MSLRSLSAAVIIALVSTLLFGNLIHSIVPHTHSHAPGQINEAWELLHSSLRHEDKKAFALIALIFLAALPFAASAHHAALAARPSCFVLASTDEGSSLDPIEEHLRRGIASYRRFG